MVIDPPFNVAYEGKTKEKLKIQNDDMTDAAFYQFLFRAYHNLASVTKEGAGIYVNRSHMGEIERGESHRVRSHSRD